LSRKDFIFNLFKIKKKSEQDLGSEGSIRKSESYKKNQYNVILEKKSDFDEIFMTL
jgi:hypothetical protein